MASGKGGWHGAPWGDVPGGFDGQVSGQGCGARGMWPGFSFQGSGGPDKAQGTDCRPLSLTPRAERGSSHTGEQPAQQSDPQGSPSVGPSPAPERLPHCAILGEDVTRPCVGAHGPQPNLPTLNPQPGVCKMDWVTRPTPLATTGEAQRGTRAPK